MTAGEAVQSSVPENVTASPTRRGGDPAITHRRDVRALDEHLADELPPAPVVPPSCGGAHSGPCDRWSACTGMTLTVVERDTIGRAHPWRLVA
ncbi:hypothetical protein JNW91_16810 [Micromonospora sp. STR1_7]|uniref:Uncharacterized protein n=1 Tax=Micromonospora parastrephiae TaxID=2806101 RepID=A0ABS1XVS6_9ACTN|nr:hypothetical protein [Micromonospora parastrephiae]MBM0233370.1 hypothetical protein [Micromonospora parastrephiae]